MRIVYFLVVQSAVFNWQLARILLRNFIQKLIVIPFIIDGLSLPSL
jgi:hypothetical protein